MRTSFLYRWLFGAPEKPLLTAGDALSAADQADSELCDKVLPRAAREIRRRAAAGHVDARVYLQDCRLAQRILEAAGYSLRHSPYDYTTVSWARGVGTRPGRT